jgi:uncharacterized membrane-anchored protein
LTTKWHVLPLLALLATVWGNRADAQDSPPSKTEAEVDAAWQAGGKVAVMGPADIPLDQVAHVKITADEAFVPAAEANRIMAAMGNGSEPNRVGLIVSRKKNVNWVVDVEWIKEGYVRDGDAAEWKPDELLESLKQATEEGNTGRTAKGLPALDVLGWVEPPAYDKATHRLVWSLQLKERGGPANVPNTINYNTYALGREGYFSLDLITGSDTIAGDKHVAHELLDSLTYVLGKRYEQFNGSTDKVAAYGLGALIGVVAAKKLGLLALVGIWAVKLWKLGLVAVVAAGAAVRRFWNRARGIPERENETVG